MALLRSVMNFLVAGALLGVLASTVAYPRFMAWDNTPAFGKALCDCAETTRQTADRLINAQMIGCVSGAGVGAVAGLVFAMMRRKKVADAQKPAITESRSTNSNLR
jgi:hypothetical protein